MQFVVDKRQHAVEGIRIAIAPGSEQRRHIAAARSVNCPDHDEDGQFSRTNARSYIKAQNRGPTCKACRDRRFARPATPYLLEAEPHTVH
jgi:hypothetical protein